MSLVAGATLLNGIGHLANLGQFVEIGQGQAFQREQMQWARRAYCLDSRALRIDLLNAVKEDVRDHHQTYASRIDTLLLVHTLLLTFALATLQYSDQFVPVSGCVECEENEHPWLVTCWVYSVSGILILPFWGIVMLIWSKLQLDHWLETSIGRLNVELRLSLSADFSQETANGEGLQDRDGSQLLEKVEGAVTRLGTFVVEHQESFKRVWNKECRFMISAATVFLWVSCILAILITSGMFWLFLQNHMEGQHRHASSHFALCTLSGLLAPAFYGLWFRLVCRRPGIVRVLTWAQELRQMARLISSRTALSRLWPKVPEARLCWKTWQLRPLHEPRRSSEPCAGRCRGRRLGMQDPAWAFFPMRVS
ncbi:unnamed protein product [Symbiodinium sp. CCMP2592]|nr:unnamed protein product [Symbiodinium sp. CCMP2592]